MVFSSPKKVIFRKKSVRTVPAASLNSCNASKTLISIFSAYAFNVLHIFIYRPSTAIQPSPRGSRQCLECRNNVETNLPPMYEGTYLLIICDYFYNWSSLFLFLFYYSQPKSIYAHILHIPKTLCNSNQK